MGSTGKTDDIDSSPHSPRIRSMAVSNDCESCATATAAGSVSVVAAAGWDDGGGVVAEIL